MCIIQLFIPVILSFVECLGQTGCLSSVPTVSQVHRCPGNVSEWVKASERKRCLLVRQNCSSDREFQYHCLINAEINGMVEVCIPIRRIVGSFCPFYDSKKARIENHYHLSCKEHKFNCPEHYQSNEAYKYQGCYMAVFGEEFTGENVKDNNHIFQKIGDKMVDIQKDTFWTVVAIVCAVVFLATFGVLSVALKLMNKETKKTCKECCPFLCYKCIYCCYKVDDNDMKGKGKENKDNDKKDTNDTNEQLIPKRETGDSDNS